MATNGGRSAGHEFEDFHELVESMDSGRHRRFTAARAISPTWQKKVCRDSDTDCRDPDLFCRSTDEAGRLLSAACETPSASPLRGNRL